MAMATEITENTERNRECKPPPPCARGGRSRFRRLWPMDATPQRDAAPRLPACLCAQPPNGLRQEPRSVLSAALRVFAVASPQAGPCSTLRRSLLHVSAHLPLRGREFSSYLRLRHSASSFPLRGKVGMGVVQKSSVNSVSSVAESVLNRYLGKNPPCQ